MPKRTREKEDVLSLDVARTLLSYDPSTGSLNWTRPPRRGVAAGPAGSFNDEGYRIVGYRGHEYMATHLIWFLVTGEWPDHGVDHKNRNRSDERWENLREATTTQNNQNKSIRRDNRTGVHGVMMDGRSGRFLSQIIVDGQRIRLGYHRGLESATTARREAELKYFGEFSPLDGGH